MPDGNNDVNTSVDGKNLGFAIDQIRSIMNKEFAQENPAATTFIGSVNIPADAESAQNLKMERGEKSSKDINRHAADWVMANRATFDGWLDQARAAAK
jgi:glycine betaine/proline transport system substrate-binding protein